MITLSDDNKSFAVPVFNGLLSPEHKKRIGAAIWEFIWCIDKTTKEIPDPDAPGKQLGVVLGGKPVSKDEMADDLGTHPQTVWKNLQKLDEEGYINLKRAPYGNVILVKNSKKFFHKNADSGLSGNADSDERINENADSRISENTNSGINENADSESGISENTDSGLSENADSNKTLQIDIARKEKEAAALASLGIEVPPPEFEGLIQSVMMMMGKPRISDKELRLMKSLLRNGVPTDTILTTLEEKLQEYAAANGGRYFSSFCYCEVPILEKHDLNTKSAKLELVHGYAQTAATQSPGAQSPAQLPPDDPFLLEKRKRIEAMQSGNAGTFGRPPA